MDVSLTQIDVADSTSLELFVKQEPQVEIVTDETAPSVVISDSSIHGVKSELESEEERPRKRRKRHQRTKNIRKKNTPVNDEIETRNNGKSPELTQLPCIINIKSSAVPEIPSQTNHYDYPIVGDSDDVVYEAHEQNTSNVDFTTKVYEILVDIQSTLKDIKAELTENTKKIEFIEKFLPQPWSWENARSNFSFPLETDEQLLEFENKLQNEGISSKLVVDLTSRAYGTWKEMVFLCLKYMLSPSVAMLYNLNGVKGSKKKFRDLNICNILVECVQYKFKEAPPDEILKRISLILAQARDWPGSKYRRTSKLKTP